MDDTGKRFLEELNMKKEQYEKAIARLKKNQMDYNDYALGDNNMDESDQAQHEISVFTNYNLIEKKISELKKVDSLIQTILKSNRFGDCEECGEPIPIERLLVVPGTTLCVDCQKELEKNGYSRGLNRHPVPYHSYREKDSNDLDELEDYKYDLIDTDLEIIDDHTLFNGVNDLPEERIEVPDSES